MTQIKATDFISFNNTFRDWIKNGENAKAWGNDTTMYPDGDYALLKAYGDTMFLVFYANEAVAAKTLEKYLKSIIAHICYAQERLRFSLTENALYKSLGNFIKTDMTALSDNVNNAVNKISQQVSNIMAVQNLPQRMSDSHQPVAPKNSKIEKI